MIRRHIRLVVEKGLAVERAILVALALAALLSWGFIELADEVAEGSALAFDEVVFHFLHGDGARASVFSSPQAMEAVRDVTALGSYSVLGLVTVTVCGYLAIVGHRRAAVFVLVAVISGLIVSNGLKIAFDRPRPELASPHAQAFTMSFPSGHSLLSAVVYLTLGSLLARLHAAWRAKAFVLGISVLFAVLVGLSRLALGVHWPTDILAGWALGASWALLCWAVFLFLQRREAVEPAAERETQG